MKDSYSIFDFFPEREILTGESLRFTFPDDEPITIPADDDPHRRQQTIERDKKIAEKIAGLRIKKTLNENK